MLSDEVNVKGPLDMVQLRRTVKVIWKVAKSGFQIIHVTNYESAYEDFLPLVEAHAKYAAAVSYSK
jgi:hypothetical protein